MAEEEAVTVTEENTDVVETPEDTTTPEPEEVETAEEADAESEPVEQEAEKPKPDPKVAKARYEARELKRQNARLLKMLEQQQEIASRVTQKESKAPNIEDFETMEAYLDARDEYRDSLRTSKKEEPQQIQYDNPRDELAEAGLEKYEDFEEVVFSEDIKVTPEMAAAIFEIDDIDLQVDIAYYLGQNPKETARIAKLPERRQIAELGKLEAKISIKPTAKAKASKAPTPIKPVSGAKTVSSEIQPVEDFESFLKKRYKQLGRT